MVGKLSASTVAGRSSSVCTMYAVALEIHFELSSLIRSQLAASRKLLPPQPRYTASFYLGLVWSAVVELDGPTGLPEKQLRAILVVMFQLFGVGRIGELRGLRVTDLTDADYAKFSGDEAAKRFRLFDSSGDELTTVSAETLAKAAEMQFVLRGTKKSVFSTPIIIRRLRPQVVGTMLARSLDIFAYLSEYYRVVLNRTVEKRGGRYEHSQSHVSLQLQHGDGFFVSTEVDTTTKSHYYVSDTTLETDILGVLRESGVPEAFKAYSGRGTAESLLFDAHMAHKGLFTNFEHQVSVSKARHSFAEFKKTYYHVSDRRHLEAISVMVIRTKALQLSPQAEELLAWYSTDLPYTLVAAV